MNGLSLCGTVFFLPFTFWTGLGYKEFPSVKITEGSILTEHNRSINLKFVGLLKTKLQGAPIGSIGIFIFRQQEKTV